MDHSTLHVYWGQAVEQARLVFVRYLATIEGSYWDARRQFCRGHMPYVLCTW
jgi:hypothetical protein